VRNSIKLIDCHQICNELFTLSVVVFLEFDLINKVEKYIEKILLFFEIIFEKKFRNSIVNNLDNRKEKVVLYICSYDAHNFVTKYRYNWLLLLLYWISFSISGILRTDGNASLLVVITDYKAFECTICLKMVFLDIKKIRINVWLTRYKKHSNLILLTVVSLALNHSTDNLLNIILLRIFKI